MERSEFTTEETAFILVENEPNSAVNFVRRQWARLSSAIHFSSRLQEVRKNRLLEAVKQNDLKEINKIAKASPELLKTYRKGGKNILQITCSDLAQFVEPKTVEKLISLGAELFYTSEECGGWNCLHFAAQSHKEDLLRLVAEATTRRNKKYINSTTEEGDTALLILIRSVEIVDNNIINCLKLLLDLEADANQQNLKDLTPVLQAHFSNCFSDVLNIFLHHEKVVLDLDSSKYEGKSGREWISQEHPGQLPLKIEEYMFKLLTEDEEAFSKLCNLEEYSNLTQGDESLIEIANRLELWKACRTLIRNSVTLQVPDFAIEVTSKCGLFKAAQKLCREQPCKNLSLFMDLCIFVFKSFREDENDSVNYRSCFEELIKSVLVLNNNKIPEFSDCPGIYLYIANMDLPLKKSYLDELVREREDFDKLSACCDNYICEDKEANNVTLHYRNFLPINDSRKVFAYLANHDIFKNIFLHTLFKAFLFARVESRYEIFPPHYTFFVYLIIFLILITSSIFWLYVLFLPAYLFFLIWSVLDDRFSQKNGCILTFVTFALFFISLVAMLALADSNIFPLFILIFGYMLFFCVAPSRGMLLNRIILQRVVIRYMKFFMDVGILFIYVAIVLHLLFRKEPFRYYLFQSSCEKYYCYNSSDLDISHGACVSALISQNGTACQEYYNGTASFVKDFGNSCNRYPAVMFPYMDFCDQFYTDVIEKGYGNHLNCTESYYCRKFLNETVPTVTSSFQEECSKSMGNTLTDLEAINGTCQSYSLQSTFDRFRDFCTPIFCHLERENFGYVSSALFQTLLMAIGEIDASSLDLVTNPYSRLIIAIIILTVHIILMNLLTGLAICDIQDIKGEAELLLYIAQVKRLRRCSEDLTTPYIIVDKETRAIENKHKNSFFYKCGEYTGFKRIRMYMSKSIHKEVLNLLSKKQRNLKAEKEGECANCSAQAKQIDNLEKKIDQMMDNFAQVCEGLEKFKSKQEIDTKVTIQNMYKVREQLTSLTSRFDKQFEQSNT